jgi:LacI family transcriptional regulator
MTFARRKKVALLIETSNAYARGLLSGVISFHQQHANWSVYLPEQDRGGVPPSWLSRWKPDGIIARIENQCIADAVIRTKRPFVDVSAAREISDVPWIETNDRRVAQLAAEHLIQRGFRNIAFCGEPGFNWSNWRLKALEEVLAPLGIPCHVHQSHPKNAPDYSWEVESKRMAAWVRSLPKPIGVMACYDIKAQQLLDTCRELDLAVPEQVAVIGVDNDRLICELCTPPLTSIALHPARIGFEAASLLARMMDGEAVSPEPLLIDPVDIIVRQSTDVLAIDDADVAKALRYIREHATANIRVGDVVAHVGLSRRQLEHRFQRWIGKTPHQEIQRRRIERVKQLLRSTRLPVAQVAFRCGFEHPEYLSVAFLRETGQSISAFRDSLQ